MRPRSATAPLARIVRIARTAALAMALAGTAACGGGGGSGSAGTPAATVQSIAVTPDLGSIAKGLTQAFTATGQYSDGSTQDLTAFASWTSGSTGVASMSAAVATGVGEGTSTIAASYAGKSGQATLTVTAATLQSITVAPYAAPVAKGQTQAFTATGHYSDATTRDLTALVTWTSASPGVATLSAAVATGVGEGTSTITATYGGKFGEATLTVTAATLQSITVSPGSGSLAKGLAQAFTAAGHYSDGSTLDLTAVATWTSSTGAATMSAAVATGVAEGTSTIAASYGGQSGQATLTVTAAALQSITVAPGTAPVAKGLAQAFTATGHYSDGSTLDLTAVATWTSSTGAATMSAAVATGVGEGTSTITASYGGQSGQATLTVTAAALLSITVAPGAAPVAKGLARAFTASGHYSDGSTLDLTGLATWTSSTGAATMSDAVATGVAEGTTTIAASYAGKSGEATLTVGPATLVSIAVDPGTVLIPEGLTTTLVATGTYSDGTTAELTETATWSSDNLLAATASAGVLAAVGQGEATITAEQDGRSGQALVSVSAAALQWIAISPASTSIAKGLSQQLGASGHYTNGTDQDLTAIALWSSESAGIASVDPGGLVTAVDVGTTSLSAGYGGQVGTATVEVTAPVLVAVVVAPGTAEVSAGLAQAFTATGLYSDGSTQDLTASATWTSSPTSVATISAEGRRC